MVSSQFATWKQGKNGLHIPNMYLVVGSLMFFCAVFIAIKSFAPEPVGLLSSECNCEGIDRCICPRKTVEALTIFQIVCLANSRVAAYILYPLYLILFLTMCRNLKAWLQHKVVVEYIPLTSLHHLHIWAGTLVGIIAMWHGLWHLIRWGVQGNLKFLVETPTGLTGLICLVLTPFIVWPMRLSSLRKQISFEVRKRMHYLSWVWMGALMFHAPAQNIFWIVGVPFVIYLIDWFYGVFMATRMAHSARFVRLESAIMIRLKKPKGFVLKGSGGYCYLCAPWVSKLEWHAFSVFKDPVDSDYICFCIATVGDWTRKLHDEIHEPVYRRLWLYGPFPSPFESAADNDNVISIASGIGITPALSAIKSLADHRKMHLIWMVRDASLLEFMINYGITFDDDAYTLIFYTGERELVFRRALPFNVILLKGRPDLNELIVSVIQASKSEYAVLDLSEYEVLDEHFDVEDAKTVEHHFYAEIMRVLQIYTVDELFNAAVRCSHLNSRKVSMEGLRALMDDISVRNFTDEQIETLFQLADTKDHGHIDSVQFQAFIKRVEEIAKNHGNEFKKKKTPRFLRSVSLNVANPTTTLSDTGNGPAMSIRVDRPEHWRLMYCGGSGKVVEILQGISTKHQIPLSVESFEW